MVYLHQYDYIFALGIMFAFLDAWNIGANDVANSFATSVSSRSLTMRQAMMIATVMEFTGALAVGARVAETIRTKILTVAAFQQEPSVLMLGMVCALVGSSLYLTIATRLGLPVSTTHSIMGGVIGVGIATIGVKGVNWGWTGVAQVFAAWLVAPGIAACFGAMLFLITKYGVLRRKSPVKAAFIMVPIYFGFTAGILTMLIVWKGAASLKLDNWSAGQVAGCIFGVAFGTMALACFFFLPYLHRKLINEDWQLRWWHIFYGPLLLRRGDVPPKPADEVLVKDYYKGYQTTLDKDLGVNPNPVAVADPEKASEVMSGSDLHTTPENTILHLSEEDKMSTVPVKLWYHPGHILGTIKKGFFHGVNVDVIGSQMEHSLLAGNMGDMHARAAHYDNKAEHTYSFLQVLTAATSSFAHGANDVSNAIGPLATIYLIWSTGELQSNTPVPLWVLAFGGGAIVVGLWTYGYNIMRNLGNRITLHSPSRGFSMELGSAVTVVMATRLALPISTTQCITGATVGVGLCSGTWRTINWRMVAWIYFGWFITLPCAGIIAGCLMGIIINAPQWGHAV